MISNFILDSLPVVLWTIVLNPRGNPIGIRPQIECSNLYYHTEATEDLLSSHWAHRDYSRLKGWDTFRYNKKKTFFFKFQNFKEKKIYN